MIQALIVKNPKWEPYDKVRDEFAKSKDTDAVLVIRGRCKQKNRAARNDFKKLPAATATEHAVNLRKQGKGEEDIKRAIATFKPALALLLALCLLTGIGARAQQSIISSLPSTTAGSFATNWSTGTGLIGINRDDQAVFQLTVVATNTLASGAVNVKLDNSDNGTDWITNQIVISTTFSGTNVSTGITRATNSVGGKWWRIGGLGNTGTGTTNQASVVRFSISK